MTRAFEMEAILFEKASNDDRIEKRFFAKVIKTETCWNWTGSRVGLNKMYGAFSLNKVMIRAHRASVLLSGRVIPYGYIVDHQCRNTFCVNPQHLRVITQRENVLSGDTIPTRNLLKKECVNGHLFSLANTRITKDGDRVCRQCNRELQRKRRSEG